MLVSVLVLCRRIITCAYILLSCCADDRADLWDLSCVEFIACTVRSTGPVVRGIYCLYASSISFARKNLICCVWDFLRLLCVGPARRVGSCGARRQSAIVPWSWSWSTLLLLLLLLNLELLSLERNIRCLV